MIRTKIVMGLAFAVSLVAVGSEGVMRAEGIGACVPVQPLPPACQPVQRLTPPPKVCYPVQPTSAVCAPAQHVVADHLAELAHHVHAALARLHTVKYVVVASPTPTPCQSVQRVQPVLPPPAACQPVQPVLPPPTACEPAKQVSFLHHVFPRRVIYSDTTAQPAVAPSAVPAVPTPAPTTPKPPAAPVKAT
jgi:hypothetical protein